MFLFEEGIKEKPITMLRFILDLYPSTRQPGTTFQKSYLYLEELNEEGQGVGWDQHRRCSLGYATRPRGRQKLAKEPLGTLREEGAVLWWEHHMYFSRAFRAFRCPPLASTVEKSLYLLLCLFHSADLGDFPAQ